ncbi:MAG: Ig-like domain-containing protein [Myxococcota bacterium]
MRKALWMAVILTAGCSGGDGTKGDPSDSGTCVGEGCSTTPPGADADGDGHDAVAQGGDDCDDADATVYPGAPETPYDGIDQDCADGDLVDVDGDQHDAAQVGGDDCDDADPAAYYGAPDTVGDGVDQSCDGIDGMDFDGDGYASIPSGGDDCGDSDPAQHPGATDAWYDGVDSDCDGACDYDMDGDGAVLAGTVVPNDSACDLQPGFGVDAPEDCDDGDPTVSTVAVIGAYPDDGDADVSVAAPVRVTLTVADAGASLAVTDAAGAPVPGALTVDGALLTFTPDAPLAAASTYDVAVTHGCGLETLSFTTEAAGTAVDPAAVAGQVYDVRLGAGTWTEPAGVGGLIATALGEGGALIDVLAASTALDLRLAPSDAGVQDVCRETTEVVGVDFAANPSFAVVPDALVVPLGAADVVVIAPTLTGRFSADGTQITSGLLVGTIDTEPLGAALGLGANPSAVCDFVGLFGLECRTCADGSSDYCLPVRVEDLVGDAVVETTVPRTAADIAADPLCY